MAKPVGFDQKIELKHLELTAREAKYTQKKEMYTMLNEYLRFDIKGDKSRRNAITMLMKIWFLVDDEHEEIQMEAFSLFDNLSNENRFVIHWGMTLLAYPFFKSVADEMGNFFNLQNEVHSKQVGRRIKMLYGDRRRVEVALSAVLTSMKFWGVIKPGSNQMYILNNRTSIQDVDLKNWLLKVILQLSEYGSIPINMVPTLTMFFPFDFTINISDINLDIFKIDRQGLDTYMISI